MTTLTVIGAGVRPSTPIESAAIKSAPTRDDARDSVVFDEARQQKFLNHLAQTSRVESAARKAGVSLALLYSARRSDPDFAAAWREAMAVGYESLELELLARARSGQLQPVFHGGKKIGTVRNFDNAMAVRLLNAFRDKQAATSEDNSAEDEAALRDDLEQRFVRMRSSLQARVDAYEAEQKAPGG